MGNRADQEKVMKNAEYVLDKQQQVLHQNTCSLAFCVQNLL